MTLPSLPSRALIKKRLDLVFAAGTPNRNYVTRDTAVNAVFTMLYIGAIDGSGIWLAPKQIYRMTDKQAGLTANAQRTAYHKASMVPGYRSKGPPWYNDNTREPIRDETIKNGLATLGAVIVNGAVTTTSSKGRYALQRDFAALFDQALSGSGLTTAIAAWQTTHLSPSAAVRAALLQRSVAAAAHAVSIRLPNGQTRTMLPGPSSVLTKAVVQEFAPRFMDNPVVLWISESGKKVVEADHQLATTIGLNIASNILPDVILVDIGPPDPIVVFVEIVYTDGAITNARKVQLLRIAAPGRFKPKQFAFLTAFQHRDAPAFKKLVGALALGSMAWFENEPDVLLLLHEQDVTSPVRLQKLLQQGILT